MAEWRDYLVFCVVFNPSRHFPPPSVLRWGNANGLGAAHWRGVGEREVLRPSAALIYLSAFARAVIHHATARPLYDLLLPFPRLFNSLFLKGEINL